MEDCRRDIMNREKRSRSDSVKHVVSSYFKKRNYTSISSEEIPLDKFHLANIIESKVSRPNSILYASWRNDCFAIDKNYSKFVTWLKELAELRKDTTDLEALIGPLFCHLYLEILRGVEEDQHLRAVKKEQIVQEEKEDPALNFFKKYVSTVDKNKCDDAVKELIDAVTINYTTNLSNSISTNHSINLDNLKETLRSNKYVLNLSINSANLLKKFVVEHCHITFLEVLQSWFEIGVADKEQEEVVMKEVNDTRSESVCNETVKLRNAIATIKRDISLTYTVNLSNINGNISCGLIDRKTNLIAYSHSNSIFLKSTDTLRQLQGSDCRDIVIRAHTGRIYDMSLIRDGSNLLVSASSDKTVGLLDLNTYEKKCVLKGHNYPIYCVAPSSNGAYVASGSYDSTVRLWNLERGSTVRVLGAHKHEVTCVDFHPNCIYFLSASTDKTVRMWNVSDATPVRLFIGSKAAVYSASFSPDGRYIASASGDHHLRVWDVVSSKQLAEIKMGAEPVTRIVWSSDQKTLLAGTISGLLKSWDFEKLLKSNQDSIWSTSLNARLLCIEHCFESFASLTVS